MGVSASYVVLCEHDERGALLVAQDLGCSVEGRRVSLYSLERLDLDKATRAIAVLHQEVRCVSSVVT